MLTVYLHPTAVDRIASVQLDPSTAVQTIVGPVRVPSKQMICWDIQGREAGYHQLVLRVDEQTVNKELAIGEGFMRISPQRPAWHWTDVLLYPCEVPLGDDSQIQAIQVDYPERHSWTAGTRSWLPFWFAVSMVAAFVARPILKVNI